MLSAKVSWSLIFVVAGFGVVVGVNTNNGANDLFLKQVKGVFIQEQHPFPRRLLINTR